MLEALATLLAFQLLGEALAHQSGLPVPGPVVARSAVSIKLAAWLFECLRR